MGFFLVVVGVVVVRMGCAAKQRGAAPLKVGKETKKSNEKSW